MPDLVLIETFSDAHKLDEVGAGRAQKHQGPRHEPRPPPPVQPNPGPDEPAPPSEEDDAPAQEPEKLQVPGMSLSKSTREANASRFIRG